jgi:Prokaryotic E2 family E
MSLPADDLAHLAERSIAHQILHEANMTCVVLPAFPLPVGYDRSEADLLLRLSAGYPDVPPDMWWFDPPVRLSDGRTVQATECSEQYLERTWQRWSRHFEQGQWRSGIDCLETFLALVRKELQRCAA